MAIVKNQIAHVAITILDTGESAEIDVPAHTLDPYWLRIEVQRWVNAYLESSELMNTSCSKADFAFFLLHSAANDPTEFDDGKDD